MAGGVQEGDGLAADLGLVGADVLGDAAGLALGHAGGADIVQQGGLAVVHVAHDHHHRSPGHQILGPVLCGVDELLLDGDHHLLLHLAAQLLGDDGGGVEVDKLAQGGHDPVLHQALDHLCAGLLHPAGQLLDGDLVGNLHGQGGLLGDLQLEAAHLLRLLLPALVGEGHLAPALAAGVAELLLVLLPVPASAAGSGAVRHVLELLVVLVQVDVGGLAGVHHLGLGHPAGAGLLGRRLTRLLALLGSGLLLGRPLLRLSAALALLSVLPAALSVLSVLPAVLTVLSAALGAGLLGGSALPGLLRRGGVRVDGLDAADLIILGQVLKEDVQFLVLQVLARLFRSVEVLAQNFNDLLGLHPKVSGQLVHFVLIDNITQ